MKVRFLSLLFLTGIIIMLSGRARADVIPGCGIPIEDIPYQVNYCVDSWEECPIPPAAELYRDGFVAITCTLVEVDHLTARSYFFTLGNKTYLPNVVK